jgi:hypothetical protein
LRPFDPAELGGGASNFVWKTGQIVASACNITRTESAEEEEIKNLI